MHFAPVTLKMKNEQWLQHYVDAVLIYTHKDVEFAESLAAQVQQKNWYSNQEFEVTASPYITPTNQPEAIRTAAWLLDTLDSHPEYLHTQGKLALWADTYEEPKNLVLGIVGLAIIGPTLGLIDTKKKKKPKLQLVVDKDWVQTLSAEQLTEKTHEISQNLIAKELRAAKGQLSNLHPDTADWCLGGATTKLYRSDRDNIAELALIATEDNLSHVLYKKGKYIVALAASPSVRDNFVDEVVE